MVLKAYDRDWAAADDPLGELAVDLSPLIDAPYLTFPSSRLSDVPTGELAFEVRWRTAGTLGSDFDETLPDEGVVT